MGIYPSRLFPVVKASGRTNMRVRVTIEYDYEDPDAFTPEQEISFWRTGNIDVPTLDDGDGCNCTVTVEKIS